MTDKGTTFTVGFSGAGAADAYEGVLVPRLFTPCAVYLLTRLGLHPGEILLDVACGTGVVARLAAPVLGTAGRVFARDLTEAMIERGGSERLPADSAPIEYGVAPADRLDIADEAMDVVTCQQGLQFFPDAPEAVREMHRVLRPGGRVGIAVWRSIDECPLWAAAQAATAQRLDETQAAVLSAPFSWPGEEALLDVLREAGFNDLVVSTHTVVMHFDARDATRALGLSAGPDDAVEIPARTLVGTGRRPP
ncbi:MAG: class I SAM-dependent methyltransferase [Actinomycetota bacterium]|nr:class I SAM-dependent methyltransferase [Actinomycetota bacterium]